MFRVAVKWKLLPIVCVVPLPGIDLGAEGLNFSTLLMIPSESMQREDGSTGQVVERCAGRRARRALAPTSPPRVVPTWAHRSNLEWPKSGQAMHRCFYEARRFPVSSRQPCPTCPLIRQRSRRIVSPNYHT